MVNRESIRSVHVSPRLCLLQPGAALAAAAELRIGLSADVTTMDPHFVAAQPNLTVQEHIFEGLVGIDERGRVVPGLATSWSTPDALTWEIKLRPGVKFHDGSELTAEDIVFSLERPLTIKGSPGGFGTYVQAITAKQIVDRHTLRLKTATPYGPLLQDLAHVLIVSKRVAARASAEDFDSGKASIGTGTIQAREIRARRPRAARATRCILGGPAALGCGHAADPAGRSGAHRVAAFGRARCDRKRADRGSRAARQELRATPCPHRIVAHHPAPSRPAPRRASGRDRQSGQAARREPVQGCARAAGAFQSDQPPGDRGARDGRPRAPGRKRRLAERHRPRSGGQARSLRSRRREEAACRSRLSERLHDDPRHAEQPLYQRRAGRAGVRSDVFAHRRHDESRSASPERLSRQSAQPGIRRRAARLGLARVRPRVALARRNAESRERPRHVELGALFEPRARQADRAVARDGRSRAA